MQCINNDEYDVYGGAIDLLGLECLGLCSAGLIIKQISEESISIYIYCRCQNTAAMPGLQDALGSLELDGDAAMRECNDMADIMGHAVGIDTVSTFAGIDLLQQNDANPLRSVRI